MSMSAENYFLFLIIDAITNLMTTGEQPTISRIMDIMSERTSYFETSPMWSGALSWKTGGNITAHMRRLISYAVSGEDPEGVLPSKSVLNCTWSLFGVLQRIAVKNFQANNPGKLSIRHSYDPGHGFIFSTAPFKGAKTKAYTFAEMMTMLLKQSHSTIAEFKRLGLSPVAAAVPTSSVAAEAARHHVETALEPVPHELVVKSAGKSWADIVETSAVQKPAMVVDIKAGAGGP